VGVQRGRGSNHGSFARHGRLTTREGTQTRGYILASNPGILPPSTAQVKCTAVASGNAMACPGACYRTVWLQYIEPGFYPYPRPSASAQRNLTDGDRKLGDYSYWKVNRVQDNVSFSLEGNLRQYLPSNLYAQDPSTRWFSASLLSGYTYEYTFIRGKGDTTFLPSSVTVQFRDGGPAQGASG